MATLFPPRKPLEMANTSWALARLQLTTNPLMQALSSQSLAQISEFYGQSIANTAWS